MDLTKILKPGMKIYSLIDGEIEITKITEDIKYPIHTSGERGSCNEYTKEGYVRYMIGECVLFPSKEERDWSKASILALLPPKNGDYLVARCSSCIMDRVFIYNGICRRDGSYSILGAYAGIDTNGDFSKYNTSTWTTHAYRYATEEEIREFDERLKKEGLYFDKVKFRLEKIDILPKTWKDCMELYQEAAYLLDGEIKVAKPLNFLNHLEYLKDIVPVERGLPVLAFHQLLLCRDTWWNRLGYKPDWGNEDEKKYVITRYRNNNIIVDISYLQNFVLAFPSKEISEKFRSTFKDLIEQAKELI